MKLTFYVSLKINRINSHLQNRPFQKKKYSQKIFWLGGLSPSTKREKKKEKKKKKRREKEGKRKRGRRKKETD